MAVVRPIPGRCAGRQRGLAPRALRQSIRRLPQLLYPWRPWWDCPETMAAAMRAAGMSSDDALDISLSEARP